MVRWVGDVVEFVVEVGSSLVPRPYFILYLGGGGGGGGEREIGPDVHWQGPSVHIYFLK